MGNWTEAIYETIFSVKKYLTHLRARFSSQLPKREIVVFIHTAVQEGHSIVVIVVVVDPGRICPAAKCGALLAQNLNCSEPSWYFDKYKC